MKKCGFVGAGKARGFSLVEMLLAIGISAVVMGAMITLQLQQLREANHLSDKLATLDLEKTLVTELSDGSTCQYILNNPTQLTFNSTALSPSSPQYMAPTLPIYSKVVAGVPGPVLAQVGSPVSGPSDSLKVASIRLKILSGVGNIFKANWEISFSNVSGIRAIKPITVSTVLIADVSIPTAAKVLSCSSNRPVFTNITYHSFCNTGVGGVQIVPMQPNRICNLSAVDDDVGNTVVGTTYKCMVSNNGTHWIGTAELACGQVSCIATCFDLL